MKHWLAIALLLALAAPAHADDWHWTFTPHGGQDFDQHPAAVLDYGVDEDESQFFLLTCRPGSGVVRFHFWIEASTPARRAIFASGAVRAAATVQAHDEGMFGGMEVDSSLPARSPVMAEFRRSGRLSVSLAGHPGIPAPGRARTATVARFLTICG